MGRPTGGSKNEQTNEWMDKWKAGQDDRWVSLWRPHKIATHFRKQTKMKRKSNWCQQTKPKWKEKGSDANNTRMTGGMTGVLWSAAGQLPSSRNPLVSGWPRRCQPGPGRSAAAETQRAERRKTCWEIPEPPAGAGRPAYDEPAVGAEPGWTEAELLAGGRDRPQRGRWPVAGRRVGLLSWSRRKLLPPLGSPRFLRLWLAARAVTWRWRTAPGVTKPWLCLKGRV